MTVLVIGASGFLGMHLIKQLTNSGNVVIGTKRNVGGAEDFVRIDLGARDEYLIINSLVEQYKITSMINLAANDVSPADRTTKENESSFIFFENLFTVLSTFRDLKLLQIGTSVRPKSADSYFSAKYKLRNLLENTSLKNQIAVLDLPKVVGPGEPLGRFTSNLMHSIIMSEGLVVLHPCHKRNFITISQVSKIIVEIIKKWNSGDSDYPSHQAENLSNFEIAQVIMKNAGQTNHGMSLSHAPVIEGCEVCEFDESPLLVKPEFFGSKEVNYFLMAKDQSVKEALLEQFEALSISHHKAISDQRNECNSNV
jgi:nucleoside-diphosphate-sugar epimerase